MSKKDGGPAFPSSIPVTINDQTQNLGYDGMTLRQWYAGQALKGICINPMIARIMESEKKDEESINKYVAGKSFALADAMIAFEENENA